MDQDNLDTMLEEGDQERCESFKEDILAFRNQILAFLKNKLGEKLHPEDDKSTIYYLMLTTLSNATAELINKKYDAKARLKIVDCFARSIVDQIRE